MGAKKYIRHTGYPGGQRVLNPIQIHNKKHPSCGKISAWNAPKK